MLSRGQVQVSGGFWTYMLCCVSAPHCPVPTAVVSYLSFASISAIIHERRATLMFRTPSLLANVRRSCGGLRIDLPKTYLIYFPACPAVGDGATVQHGRQVCAMLPAMQTLRDGDMCNNPCHLAATRGAHILASCAMGVGHAWNP